MSQDDVLFGYRLQLFDLAGPLESRPAAALSANGVCRCLRRHGLNTRAKRLSLVAGYRAPYQSLREPEQERLAQCLVAAG